MRLIVAAGSRSKGRVLGRWLSCLESAHKLRHMHSLQMSAMAAVIPSSYIYGTNASLALPYSSGSLPYQPTMSGLLSACMNVKGVLRMLKA